MATEMDNFEKNLCSVVTNKQRPIELPNIIQRLEAK